MIRPIARMFFLAVLWLAGTAPAWAACTNPAGNEGQIIYNTTYKVAQFCNGTDWINMGVSAPQSDSGDGNSPGQVSFFSMNSCPSGWLSANGDAISRATYADLFSAIGTTFGSGDGSTTFNLPDLRGEFLRALDSGRGVDSGRVLGSAQTSQTQSISHFKTENTAVVAFRTVSVTTDGAWSASTGTAGGNQGSPYVNLYMKMTTSETRPRNIALLACIRH